MVLHSQRSSWLQALKEAAQCVQLRHPNIVSLLGVSQDPGTMDWLLVMSCLERGTLADLLQNEMVELVSCCSPTYDRLLVMLRFKPGMLADLFQIKIMQLVSNFTPSI